MALADELTRLESWIIRLLMTLLFFVGDTGLLKYVLMWVFVPSE